MAISRAAVPTTASTATSGSTVTPSYPATPSAGWIFVMSVLSKRGVTVATPSGWTANAGNNKSGGAGADGANSGTVTVDVFTKVSDGTETGTVTVSFSGGTTNVVSARIGAYQNATGSWLQACTGGADTSAGTSYSATMDADPGITTNDWVLAISGINTSTPTWASEALTGSGITTALQAELLDSGIASGDTMRLVWSEHTVSAGPSSGAPTFAMTASGNLPAGATVLLRLRETSATTSIPVIMNQYRQRWS